MIAHLPLNNVLFTTNLYIVFDILIGIVSFDLLSPFDYIDFGFSETDPYSENFEWLGYDSANFFTNLGSIAMFMFFLCINTLVNPILTFMKWRRIEFFSLVKRYRMRLSEVVNSWITTYLECYFELFIASIAGLLMLQMEELSFADRVTLDFAVLNLPLVLGFALFITWYTLVHIRYLVRLAKRDYFVELSEIPECNRIMISRKQGFNAVVSDAMRLKLS